MSKKECDPFRANIPAYVLQALEAGEVASLEAHLRNCASCQEEVAAYRRVGENLLLALPPQPPPPALRRRLEERLRPARPRRSVVWSVAIALLVALNLFSLIQIQVLQHRLSQLAHTLQTSQLAISMLAYPGVESIPVKANVARLGGTLLLDKERDVAVLFLWDLPPLQENQVYQVWLIDSQGERTSVALFEPDPELPFTAISILSPYHLSNFNALGVTVEPRGGSPSPTGPRLLRIEF